MDYQLIYLLCMMFLIYTLTSITINSLNQSRNVRSREILERSKYTYDFIKNEKERLNFDELEEMYFKDEPIINENKSIDRITYLYKIAKFFTCLINGIKIGIFDEKTIKTLCQKDMYIVLRICRLLISFDKNEKINVLYEEYLYLIEIQLKEWERTDTALNRRKVGGYHG